MYQLFAPLLSFRLPDQRREGVNKLREKKKKENAEKKGRKVKVGDEYRQQISSQLMN